jgi:predicted porin
MNKKLLAAAVASTLAAPTVASADVNWYGSVRVGVTVVDNDADTTADVASYSSRVGVNASEDLGNGLTALGRYEFTVNADKGNLSSAATSETNRLTYVGLSSETFGEVTLGSVWSPMFDHIGTLMDPSLNIGGWAYFGGNGSGTGTYRIADTIKWTNDFGPLALGGALQMDGGDPASDGVDRFQLAGTFGGDGPISVALGFDKTEADPDDRDIVAAGIRWAGDGFWANAAFITSDDGSDDDTTGIALLVGGSANSLSWYVSAEKLEDDDAEVDTDGDELADAPIDDTVFTLNLTHAMSSRTKAILELRTISADQSAQDENRGLVALRHDF